MCCFGSSVGLQKTGLTPLLFLDEQDGMCPYVCGGSRCNPKFRSFLLGMPGESSWKLSFKLGPRTAFGSRGRPNPHGPRPFAKRKGTCRLVHLQIRVELNLPFANQLKNQSSTNKYNISLSICFLETI